MEVDEVMAGLYEITDEELEEVKKTLRVSVLLFFTIESGRNVIF